MIKNYANPSSNKPKDLKPKPETISFLINYSKSFSVTKGTKLKEIRFDKN